MIKMDVLNLTPFFDTLDLPSNENSINAWLIPLLALDWHLIGILVASPLIFANMPLSVEQYIWIGWHLLLTDWLSVKHWWRHWSSSDWVWAENWSRCPSCIDRDVDWSTLHWHSINIWLTPWLTLDWHLIDILVASPLIFADTPLSVYWAIHMNWLSLTVNWLTVSWVSIKTWIKCWLSVS